MYIATKLYYDTLYTTLDDSKSKKESYYNGPSREAETESAGQTETRRMGQVVHSNSGATFLMPMPAPLLEAPHKASCCVVQLREDELKHSGGVNGD